MAIHKDHLRAGGVVVFGLLAVFGGARLVYGPAEGTPPIAEPPILTIPAVTQPVDTAPTDPTPDAGDLGTDQAAADGSDPADADPEASVTDRVIERIGSGDVDFVGVMTGRGSEEELDAFERSIGRGPDVIQVSIGWELDGYDPGLVPRIVDRGALPSIAWEPWDYRPDIWNQPDYALARILAGEYDEYIDQWAVGLAETRQPVMLRFAHEANGDWYPWAESRNGNTTGEYVATWRHLHDRFEAAGADNVIWVWSPNINPFGSWPMAGVYPGDDYVDLVGLVGYWGHFGRTPTEVGTFESVFGASIDEIRTITDKPIFISETGASDEGGFKAAWIEGFLRAVAERRDVVGFVWFEADKESDWRIESSPESLASFLEGLTLPAYVR